MKVITNDLFNIAKRIKQIDSNYFIVYNKRFSRYEVHYKKQIGSKIAFCLGNKLNAYAIKKAIVTSCKYSNKIIKEINKSNKILQQKKEQEFANKHIETLNSYLNYANRKNIDVDF